MIPRDSGIGTTRCARATREVIPPPLACRAAAESRDGALAHGAASSGVCRPVSPLPPNTSAGMFVSVVCFVLLLESIPDLRVGSMQ